MTLKNFGYTCSPLRYAVFLLICASVSIQQVNAQQLLWQRVFDTGVEDYAEGITTDVNGNIIVTGRSALQTSSESCLTIKYNQAGDTIWTRWYDINANDITTDRFGNIILAGDMWNDSTNADIRIIKCDNDGNILWTRTYCNGVKDFGEFGYGVAVDTKNNIIVTGRTTYNWGDYITIKYDSSGNLLWIRTYDGGWEDCATSVAVDDSDNVIVTGYSDSNINWDWCTIKYSSEGDILWIKRYDVALTDWAFGVIADKEGNVIVVGETHQLLPGTGGSSGMIVKYTSEGDILLIKIFTDTLQFAEVVSLVDVVTDDDCNIYVAGNYVQWETGGRVWYDYYVAKCNPQGDTLWTTRCGVNVQDEPRAIALDKEGNIIATGTTSANTDMGEYDYLTVKLHNVVDKVEENFLVPFRFDLFQNYPNPFNPSTTITYQLPKSGNVTIKIFDILGNEVKNLVNEQKEMGRYNVRFDASSLASGMYVYRLRVNDYISTKKMLLLK